MMYMGTPDSFKQTNFTPIVDMQYQTLAGYVNDEWKLPGFWKVGGLTLVLGARIEHLGPWTDRHGNGLATFDPAIYNQQCARTNESTIACAQSTDYPGITWHGINNSIANAVNNPPTVYFTPRLGLAWDIFGHGNTVLRGGWGVYRHEEEFAPYAQAAATAQGYAELSGRCESIPGDPTFAPYSQLPCVWCRYVMEIRSDNKWVRRDHGETVGRTNQKTCHDEHPPQ